MKMKKKKCSLYANHMRQIAFYRPNNTIGGEEASANISC